MLFWGIKADTESSDCQVSRCRFLVLRRQELVVFRSEALPGLFILIKQMRLSISQLTTAFVSLIGFCLLLVEPERGDFLADGLDVANGDGAHDEQTDEDSHADARTTNAEGAYHVHIG